MFPINSAEWRFLNHYQTDPHQTPELLEIQRQLNEPKQREEEWGIKRNKQLTSKFNTLSSKKLAQKPFLISIKIGANNPKKLFPRPS